MSSTTAWKKVHEEMLQRHSGAFERLYPQGYPGGEDVDAFENAINEAVSRNQIPTLTDPQSVDDKIDIWIHAHEILKYSAQHCPIARQGSLPTVSQVYLELVLDYLVLYDGLYKDAKACLAKIKDDPKVSSIERLFLVQDHLPSSGKDVPMIRNVRNALAHTRLTVQVPDANVHVANANVQVANMNVIYCGTTDPADCIIRPLEDISLVGKLLWRYTLSVLYIVTHNSYT